MRVFLMAICLLGFVACGSSDEFIAPTGGNSGDGDGDTEIVSFYEYGLTAQNTDETILEAEYNSWKSFYVRSQGAPAGTKRVYKTDNTRVSGEDNAGATVSEGIAYGMLIAVMMEDQTTFDELHGYYKAYTNSNGLMAWAIDSDGDILSSTVATDADFDVAYALLMAEKTFTNKKTYLADAKVIIAALKTHTIESGTFVVKPGDTWGGSNVTNPSYFSPAYFKIYGEVMNDQVFWDNVADKSYVVLFNSWNENTGLVPDWCKADGTQSGNRGYTYSYDACRTPWRIATDRMWFNDSDAIKYCDALAGFIQSEGVNGLNSGYNLDGTAIGGSINSVFASTFSLGVMGASSQYAGLKDQLYTLNVGENGGGYFGQTLRMMSLLIENGKFFKYE